MKGKKKLEEDVADLQGQLDMLTKSKKEVISMGPTRVANTLSLPDRENMFDGFKSIVDEYFFGHCFVRARKNT